jgi:hypothetical protein
MADDNNVRDFAIEMNLSGVTAADGGGKLPNGVYKGKVNDMYMKPENTGRVVIVVEVAEGPFAGAKRTTGINVPKDEKDNVRAYWRALAESCGIDSAKLDKGAVKLTAKAFVGKGCFFDYANAEEEGGYDQVRFLRQGTYERKLAAIEEGGEPARVSPAARKPATAPRSGVTRDALAERLAEDTEDADVRPRSGKGKQTAAAADDLDELL